MSNLPSNLPEILHKHGLKVVEVPGWQTRGRPASTGGFAPGGVLCHHTATSKATSVEDCLHLLVNGRSDLPGPLCQLSLDRQGVVYVVAAGRANHAGVAKPSGTMVGGDGNVLYIGIEAQNAGTGEPWPKVQYDAYWLLAAVLSFEITHNSAQTVRAHKETSVTGKIDPAGPTPDGPTFDMDKFRARVATAIAAMKKKATPPAAPSRRTRFTRRRKKRGQTRPAPLVVRVANCASVSTSAARATDTFKRALTTPGVYGLPDVVLGQEMSDVDAKTVATQVGGWAVIQHGAVGSPDSGLAIAMRQDRATATEDQLLPGTPGTTEGGGIRRRPILQANLAIDRGTPQGWGARFASGHAAPGRAPKDRAAFLDVFKGLRARVRGGDLNVAARVAATVFRQRVFTIGVLHLVVARWIPAKGPEPVDHGSDHPGVDVVLWPAK